MNPASQDFKDILEDAGVGSFAATSGWGIYISREPDGDNYQNTVVTLYDTGAADTPHPEIAFDEPMVQARVRGDVGGYPTAYDKILEVRDQLLGKYNFSQGGINYVGIWVTGDISFIGYDDSSRPILTVNFRAQREPDPSNSPHRR